MSAKFFSKKPRLDEFWRALILFGRNSASYKFALAKTLLDLEPGSGQLVKLEDLAPKFTHHICEHLKNAPKQGASSSSQFLSSCRRYIEGTQSEQQLLDDTVRLGFANVIDAFHVLGSGDIEKRFFIDQRQSRGGIEITDDFSQLQQEVRPLDLFMEAESRWRLVETAWDLGLSRNVVGIEFDVGTENLTLKSAGPQRRSVTSARGALNGYQKGQCFYCFGRIELDGGVLMPDVDHVLPRHLQNSMKGINLDGIWNLVLACRDCNRGTNGKFGILPDLLLFERLNTRNEFLISSHHPLRETLIAQLGTTEKVRVALLRFVYGMSEAVFPAQKWLPAIIRDRPSF